MHPFIILLTSTLLASVSATSGEVSPHDGARSDYCGFDTVGHWSPPSGLEIGAWTSANWVPDIPCGACMAVTYGGKTVNVVITDQCAGCSPNHLDILNGGFTRLTGLSAGVPTMTWSWIECPISSPIYLIVQADQWWAGFTVLNANQPVKTFEYRQAGGAGGAWTPITQEKGRFVKESGVEWTSVDVRLTSTEGTELVVSGVPAVSQVENKVTAGGNFGKGGGQVLGVGAGS